MIRLRPAQRAACFSGKDQTKFGLESPPFSHLPAICQGFRSMEHPQAFPLPLPTLRALGYVFPFLLSPMVPSSPVTSQLTSLPPALFPQGASSPGQCCQKESPQSTDLTIPTPFSEALSGSPAHGIWYVLLIPNFKDFHTWLQSLCLTSCVASH